MKNMVRYVNKYFVLNCDTTNIDDPNDGLIQFRDGTTVHKHSLQTDKNEDGNNVVYASLKYDGSYVVNSKYKCHIVSQGRYSIKNKLAERARGEQRDEPQEQPADAPADTATDEQPADDTPTGEQPDDGQATNDTPTDEGMEISTSNELLDDILNKSGSDFEQIVENLNDAIRRLYDLRKNSSGMQNITKKFEDIKKWNNKVVDDNSPSPSQVDALLLKKCYFIIKYDDSNANLDDENILTLAKDYQRIMRRPHRQFFGV